MMFIENINIFIVNNHFTLHTRTICCVAMVADLSWLGQVCACIHEYCS